MGIPGLGNMKHRLWFLDRLRSLLCMLPTLDCDGIPVSFWCGFSVVLAFLWADLQDRCRIQASNRRFGSTLRRCMERSYCNHTNAEPSIDQICWRQPCKLDLAWESFQSHNFFDLLNRFGSLKKINSFELCLIFHLFKYKPSKKSSRMFVQYLTSVWLDESYQIKEPCSTSLEIGRKPTPGLVPINDSPSCHFGCDSLHVIINPFIQIANKAAKAM